MRVPPARVRLDAQRHDHAGSQQPLDRFFAARHRAVEQEAQPVQATDPPSANLPLDQIRRHHGARPRRHGGEPAGREVPQPLLPVAADDHHFPLRPQDVQEHRRVLPFVVPPAGLPALGGPVLEVTGAERPAGAQLTQRIPDERIVRDQPIPDVLVPLPMAVRVALHRDPMQRQVAHRHDVRPIFEHRAVGPHPPLELRDPERRPEPAEQQQVLRPGNNRRRIHLDLAQGAEHLVDRTRPGRVEALPHHHQLARPPARDLHTRLGHGAGAYRAARTSPPKASRAAEPMWQLLRRTCDNLSLSLGVPCDT